MLSENMINKETAEVLKPKNVKPARFYLLPKIHKKNIPGRPVISGEARGHPFHALHDYCCSGISILFENSVNKLFCKKKLQ